MRFDACFDNNNSAKTMLNYTTELPSVRCFGVRLSVIVCTRKGYTDVVASSRVCLGGFWVDSDWIIAAKACACATLNCIFRIAWLRVKYWTSCVKIYWLRYIVTTDGQEIKCGNISFKSIRTADCLLNLFKHVEYKILQNTWRMKKHHGECAGPHKQYYCGFVFRVICLELSKI